MSEERPPTAGQIYAVDRAAWRSWLEANHDTAERIRLVYYKAGSGKPSVSYDEAVEEALCFGWIDSRVNWNSPSFVDASIPR